MAKRTTSKKKTLVKTEQIPNTLSPDIKRNLEAAKEAEKREPLTRKEEVEVYSDGLNIADRLRKLLTPSWKKPSQVKKKRKK